MESNTEEQILVGDIKSKCAELNRLLDIAQNKHKITVKARVNEPNEAMIDRDPVIEIKLLKTTEL